MQRRKPRYTLTDTGELSDQLDQAQRCWPEISDRKELLLKLVAGGNAAIEEEKADRGRAVKQTAGALTGVYEPGELKSSTASQPLAVTMAPSFLTLRMRRWSAGGAWSPLALGRALGRPGPANAGSAARRCRAAACSPAPSG
jgi:hypothetical protein